MNVTLAQAISFVNRLYHISNFAVEFNSNQLFLQNLFSLCFIGFGDINTVKRVS